MRRAASRARRRDARDPERERDEPPSLAQEHAPVLALQRAAGNAAVVAWLRSTPAAALARKRNLPESADSLDDVASAAREMTIITDGMAVGALGRWVTASRGAERDGMAVEIRFPGAMAKPHASADNEKKVKTALSAIGMSFFNLTDDAAGAARLDVVRFAELDFTPFGGFDGHYRFTCVTRTPKQGKKDAQIDLIIELVRATRPAFKDWAAMDAARKNELENRFTRLGFTQAQPDPLKGKVVDTWSKDQFGYVLQALEAIPDATLAAVPGIEWERAHGQLGPGGEAGEYSFDPKKSARRLQIYDGAFTSLDGLTALIAHEIGHALSYKPPSEKKGAASVASSKAFQDAVTADGGKAITGYAKKNAEEHYAELYSQFVTEPETLRVLRPNVFAFFTAHPTGGPVGPAAAAKPK